MYSKLCGGWKCACLRLFLATSAIVSVNAQKCGGQCVHPIGMHEGRATRLEFRLKSGKTTADSNAASENRCTM
jgi:hypothetical protein